MWKCLHGVMKMDEETKKDIFDEIRATLVGNICGVCGEEIKTEEKVFVELGKKVDVDDWTVVGFCHLEHKTYVIRSGTPEDLDFVYVRGTFKRTDLGYGIVPKEIVNTYIGKTTRNVIYR